MFVTLAASARIRGMRISRHLVSFGLLVTAVACSGGSGPESGGGSPSASSANGAASSGAQAASASLKAVPHEKLLELLPKLSGWTRETEPTGDTDSAANVSRVQVNYQQDGGTG